MRVGRVGQKFWVRLGADEEGVLGRRKFEEFHQAAVRRTPGKDCAARFQLFYVFRIDFVAMAVALGNNTLAVGLPYQ